MVRLCIVALTAGLVLGWPRCASAELYKWIDTDGTVNYGDSPPKGARNVRALDKSSGSLSVIPGIPKEERERLRERDERARLLRLEREVEELRALEAARAAALPEVIYTESWVPVYGGTWPHRVRPPIHGHKPKPEQPIAKQRPPQRSLPVEGFPIATPRDPPGSMLRR